MLFKKRTVFIIILVVSVLGLFVIQYQYLRLGLNLAKVQFAKKIELVNKDLKKELAGVNKLTFMMGSAMTNDSTSFTVDIDSVREASNFFLKDFIKYKLALSGIDADFSYGLFSRDSVTYLSAPSNIISENGRLIYPVELEGYLPGLVQRDLILELRFMDMNSYFLSKLNGLTIPSLIFFVAIILVVVWILRSFYWQRNLITTTNEFINNLTHELKTPVFSIGLATKILEEHATAHDKPIVDLIRQETERLKNHIDKVLDIGNLEQGKKVFVLTRTDFRPILTRICKAFEALSSLENVDFSCAVEPGEFYINTAADHLENAINNILDNAKKYSENPIIKLSAKTEGKKLKIVIIDNGIGIDKKNLPKVFNKYYRVTNGNLYKTKGYGLGLSYAKRVVEGHRGRISIESVLGQGTTVTVSVPLSDHGKEI